MAAGSFGRLASRLERVRASLVDVETAVDLEPFGAQRESARNLLHYIAFRRFDLRREQARLAQWGLSSLGRSESHVLYNLDVVIGWLDPRRRRRFAARRTSDGPDPERGRKILARNALSLLGPTRLGRGVRIMVTMPAEAATDYRLVRDLIDGGMDCARINCAHEGPAEWARMISHIHRAERALGRRCRIEMDLPGPKIRTGTIRPGPAVMKVRPSRDALGRVTRTGSLWLLAPGDDAPREEGGKALEISREWLLRRRRGERVDLIDARGARRALTIASRAGARCRAQVRKTTYLTNGTRLVGTTIKGQEDETSVTSVPATEQRIRLRLGDRLVVTARPDPGEEARRDRRGRVLQAAHIACTLPEGLRYVRRGESVWFDDGRIGCVVRSANPDRLLLEVMHAPEAGAWLAADRGINLPETDLALPPIPAQDVECLRFIVRHADLVGLSFVHTASDLERLRTELARLGRPRMAIVLKVETRRGFEELPGILLGALRQPPVGVMIARGDLAVEVGFERLAEVQEEILWLCEAAHLPVIWATQVLEGLTKTGFPSRAEVTDAAMGERAECVMLNKGPHVVVAVQALDGILRRMQSHQAKKTAMLRHLHIVERFFAERTRTPRGRAGRQPPPRAGRIVRERLP
ncbi:MAG: pyruvate kinase [Thermoplasmata archaeon]